MFSPSCRRHRPRAVGVKNWPGTRNRLPHPVCKPLDTKEGGADGFVCRAARKPILHTFSLTLGAIGSHGIRPIAFRLRLAAMRGSQSWLPHVLAWNNGPDENIPGDCSACGRI